MQGGKSLFGAIRMAARMDGNGREWVGMPENDRKCPNEVFLPWAFWYGEWFSIYQIVEFTSQKYYNVKTESSLAN